MSTQLSSRIPGPPAQPPGTAQPLAASASNGTATFYGYQQPVNVGRTLVNIGGLVFGVADVQVCAKPTSAAAPALATDRSLWVLHYANGDSAMAAAINYPKEPSPAYPLSRTTVTPNSCVRGKVVYPVTASPKPISITYLPSGASSKYALTWHLS